MSEQYKLYKLMIYFAVSTMHMNQKDVKISKEMTIDEFSNANKEMISLVLAEAISIFHYELSYNQLHTAIQVFMKNYLEPDSPINKNHLYLN